MNPRKQISVRLIFQNELYHPCQTRSHKKLYIHISNNEPENTTKSCKTLQYLTAAIALNTQPFIYIHDFRRKSIQLYRFYTYYLNLS